MSEVDQFVSITGADLETARFYLQSSGDNLEVAVNNFFAEGTSTGVAAEPPQQEEAPVSSPAHVTQQSSQPAGTSSRGPCFHVRSRFFLHYFWPSKRSRWEDAPKNLRRSIGQPVYTNASTSLAEGQ